MPEFLHVISSEEFVRHLSRFARPLPEHVSLDAALQRLAAADLTSPEDLPEWARSTVDGYAVRAEDTFGASVSIPCFLEVTAAVEMGMIPDAVPRGRFRSIKESLDLLDGEMPDKTARGFLCWNRENAPDLL